MNIDRNYISKREQQSKEATPTDDLTIPHFDISNHERNEIALTVTSDHTYDFH